MSRAREAEPAILEGVLPLLRRAAAALRDVSGRGALTTCLNEFMQMAPALRGAWVELPVANARGNSAATSFSPQALTLPLRAGVEVVGALRHRLDGPPLDGERLRILGAVADLLAAILAHPGRAADEGVARRLLDLVLAHTPCGVVCFAPTGEVVAANASARLFGGDADALSRLLLSPVAGVDPAAGPPVHLVRSGDRAMLVHVHAGPRLAHGGASGSVALLLDLGERSQAFLGAVARETYRALWLGKPLALAVLAAPNLSIATMDPAGTWCSRLPPGAEYGPLDGDAVAILAPETTPAALRALIRSSPLVCGIAGLRVGVMALQREHHTPEAFLAAAVAALGPVERLSRPILLLCDSSPSVTEALEVALRIDCDAVRCHDHAAGFQLLGTRTFDAIFSKIELDDWDADIGFLHRALELQPSLKPFIVTDAAGLYSASIPDLPAGTPVFRKPFQVAAVRQAVRQYFAGRESAA